MLAHYIPEAVLHKIDSTAQYDPVREEWLLIRLNYAGNVLRVRYALRKEEAEEAEVPRLSACPTGTYDLEKKTAVLVGSVVLTQGDNVLHGQKLVMDLTTGRSRLEGTSLESDGRVRAIFSPSQDPQ